ncbi:UTP--glucose-1-phosphate uridylyltransferase GalU [Marine Group III euryarchaeote]|nr:UTP--glucose-1-phosphate uridylyltransferase GalU [Marine Group III euryarchaeote]
MSENIKAIIPAAGFGTRFLPLTKAQPKEMLSVVDRPTIQWVVEEALDAGITDILIITGRSKRAIEDHFDRSIELEAALEKAGKYEELENVKKVSELANIHYIRQKTQNGLGDAVLCAKQHVGNSPFVVMLGDTICQGTPNCTTGLIDIYKEHNSSVFAVMDVLPGETDRYGIIDGTEIDNNLWQVEDMVEKPEPSKAPSSLGILGRYLFTPDLFDYQLKVDSGIGGEIQLTDAMSLMSKKEKMLAWNFPGRRYDIGTLEDWFKAHTELVLKSEWGSNFRKWLENK